tara:strand:+ start:287 stop:1822 length:1536 start_codon:yes stop_codon:yes gene_type:complete
MNYILRSMKYLGMLILLVLVSCQPTVQVEDDHAHDAAGNHLAPDQEIPTVDYTVWTDKTELFVEFPVLTVGFASRFAAHFTVLDKHQPVREGAVTVSLIKNEKGIRNTAEEPARAGIFSPTLQPKEAGIYQLVFDIKTPSLTDRIVINNVQVFATIEEAIETIGVAEDDGSITFLKEQAWKINFQTSPAIERDVYDLIPTSGVWKVSPTDYQTLAATNSGTVSFKRDNMTEGSQVRKGEVLMMISSDRLTANNLGAEIQKAKAVYDQALSEYERKRQLYESKIVPKSELEQSEQKYNVAKSAYETLSKGYSSEGKSVVAEFEGYIKTVSVNNGAFVEQGAPLLVITSHESSLLEVQVSPTFAAQLGTLQDIRYQPEAGVWSSLKETGGRIISVGKEVERDKPLLSVFASINEVVKMPEGSFTEAQLIFGEPVKALTIPESALLEDYGSYSVIVQLSGESFERRQVAIGKRNGKEVEIKSGLSTGEVVVVLGAYQVKMASMSGQTPAHGHEH